MAITDILQTQFIPTGDFSNPRAAERPFADRRAEGAPPYTVEISSRAREISAALQNGEKESARTSVAGSTSAAQTYSPKGVGAVECQTCRNRRYQDVSNDSSVSFQTATRIAPGAEESLVRAHEQEHVSHEQVRAKENGGEVVSQNVVIHYQICPECGRSYVAGGTTTTVTRNGAANGGAGEGGEGEKDEVLSAYA